MEVQGKIKVIQQAETFGTFTKRGVVVTMEGEYPQDIMIEFIQDKCSLLDSYKVGQDVTIGINLRGKLWTNPEGVDKYFNTIQGWKINANSTQDAASVTQPEAIEHVEDLPF
jgi:hypothetical protein